MIWVHIYLERENGRKKVKMRDRERKWRVGVMGAVMDGSGKVVDGFVMGWSPDWSPEGSWPEWLPKWRRLCWGLSVMHGEVAVVGRRPEVSLSLFLFFCVS